MPHPVSGAAKERLNGVLILGLPFERNRCCFRVHVFDAHTHIDKCSIPFGSTHHHLGKQGKERFPQAGLCSNGHRREPRSGTDVVLRRSRSRKSTRDVM